MNNRDHEQSTFKEAILLVNLGTPSDAEYFPTWRFLASFLSDSRVIEIPKLLWYPILYGIILPFRSYASAEKYKNIRNEEQGMPLYYHSKNILEKLRKRIARDDIIIELCMTYEKPNIREAMRELKKQHIKSLVVLPLFPQYSATTTASIMDIIGQEFANWRFIPNFQFINGYWDHPAYIDVICQQIVAHKSQVKQQRKLIISYHGLPKRNLQLGDPYYCLCHKTTRLIAENLSLKETDYIMTFQSRFGPSEWLQPYTEDTLRDLAKSGHTELDIIAPGFITDCLETDDEIKREYQETFTEAGGKKLHYIAAMNDNKEAIEFFYQLIRSRTHIFS